MIAQERTRQLADALGPLADNVAIVTSPWTRMTAGPHPGAGVTLMDLSGAIAACPGWGEAAQDAWCAQVAGLCRGAGLLLVGSEAELGFWSAYLGRAAVSAPLVVCPPAATFGTEHGSGAACLWIVARDPHNPALRPRLDQALAWAGTARLDVHLSSPEPLAAAALSPDRLDGSAPGRPAMLLDLREDTPAERVVVPPAVVAALIAGVPVLTTVDGPLGQDIAAAGAGVILGETFARFDGSANDATASAFAARFDMAAAGAALRAAVTRAIGRDGRSRSAWRRSARPPTPLGPSGHVLVLSDESQTLEAVRVRLPFGALHRRGAIGGYAIMRHGRIVFDTRPAGAPGGHAGATSGFDAIWVHRSMDPATQMLLELLRHPFVYDVDDNLLAQPSYREPFHPVASRSALALLRAAPVISCATARLAQLLAARVDARLADRLVITPNLAAEPPLAREPGPPRALVWASSDRPALTASRTAVLRAMRDHCLAHGTKLVCIGSAPPPELAGSGLAVEAVGLLPHASYREHLRALSPSILVCPLETGAGPETQDFVDGKSDIKAIEALTHGLVGVFSRAKPYTDTTLGPLILCDNTYAAWVAGLEQARSACLAPEPAPGPAWPPERDAADFGLAPWATALARVRLPHGLALEDVRAAHAAALAQEVHPITPEEFDEEDYLANHADVREAVLGGTVHSGYAHYALSGRGERRHARRLRTPAGMADAWWGPLLHEVGRLEASSGRRAAELATLERRLALREALRARAL